MTKIVHLSHSDSNGGAAIAARRLNHAMTAAGLESALVTAKDLLTIRPNASCIEKIYDRIHSRFYWKQVNKELKQYHLKGSWSCGASLNHLDTNPLIQQADVVYLHWVNHSMLSVEEIGHLLDSGKQVIWFLHDMWPMTGGCHYAFDCKRYQHHCGACPMLGSEQERDLSWKVFERKLKCLTGRSNLTIATPSLWMAECAKYSRLFGGYRVEAIPNVVDPFVFHPIPKDVVRDVLGLPKHRKLILFGCDGGTRNFYKGWNYLEKVLQQLHMTDTSLLVFGQEGDTSLAGKCGMDVHFLGYLHDEFPSLALAYNTADVFVSPSIAENFSQTMCEASACGTPAVCFDIGGNSDIVLHKQTGYLAKYKDADDLARGIDWILNHDDAQSLSQNAREHISNLCSPQIVIKKHQTLIESLLE